jgi:adenosylcobinamide-GDP ribazoletransferase
MLSAIKRETRIFLTALMFLTRLPVPRHTDHRREYLMEAPRYFSWVGLIVSGLTALSFFCFRLLFSSNIALVAAMLIGIGVTGAFHEDGLADVCDGFGGGWTKEKILLIMKDSRLGTFGVIGLIGALGLKFLFLQALLPGSSGFTGHHLPDLRRFNSSGMHRLHSPDLHWLAILFLAHSGSRFCATAIMQVFPYATGVEFSKSREATGKRLGVKGWCLSTAALLVPLCLLPSLYGLTLLPAFLGAYGLARYFARWIGGYTGDCLGAIQQVTEILIYASAYVLLTHGVLL